MQKLLMVLSEPRNISRSAFNVGKFDKGKQFRHVHVIFGINLEVEMISSYLLGTLLGWAELSLKP